MFAYNSLNVLSLMMLKVETIINVQVLRVLRLGVIKMDITFSGRSFVSFVPLRKDAFI